MTTEEWTSWMHSPQCPWCGDEVSYSPDEDFPQHEFGATCGGCGALVDVEVEVVVRRRARKAAEARDGD